KGSAEPLVTYLVTRAAPGRAAHGERGVEGVQTPLVGRDGEVETLLSTVASASESGTTRLATVVGDAGLGKTRLMRELESRLPAGAVKLVAQSHPASLLQ